MTNNNATGTFTGLIAVLAALALPVFLGVSDTHATASSITVTITSGDSPSNPIITKIPPTPEGKFMASAATNLLITTDHAAGYTLTATATPLSFTDTTVNPNVTHTIDTLAVGTAINAATFEDPDNVSYKNTWGYQPSSYSNGSTIVDNTTDNTKFYLPAPIGGQVLDITDDNTSGKTYTVSIGAKVDHTIAQGFYKTNFTFAAVGNATPYTITYNANDGASGANTTNMPTSPETGSITGEEVTISSNTPARTGGYLFKGWCTVAVSDNAACSGTSYTVGGTYTLDQTITDNTLALYAMWNTDPCYNETDLYNLVACQVKKDASGNERTQTLADMQAFLTEPTSDSPLADTSNSGVYKYDSATFGAASDAANTSNIYYFRGILDKTYKYSDAPNGETSGIPSTGDSAYYQNYVRLSDTTGGKSSTCWRIVRTTGSGGIKMIYNGTWNATDGCARAQGNAQVTSAYYNRGGSNTNINYDKVNNVEDLYGTRGFIAYVGYNYNDDYKYAGNPSGSSLYTTSTLNTTLFKNTNGSGTMTASNLKTTIENWYTNTSNLASYATNNKLETSAGWCNDRTTTASPNGNDKTVPYAPGSTYGTGGGIDFGAGRRNYYANKSASLTCPNVTGQDLLTTDNGFLNKPLAPLTEDEVVFAGHGYPAATTVEGQTKYYPTTPSNYSSKWSYRSFLRSGSTFWLLSPRYRGGTNGHVFVFYVDSIGYSGGYLVYYSFGVRPAISLTSGTIVASGSGTAADPWVVNP